MLHNPHNCTINLPETGAAEWDFIQMHETKRQSTPYSSTSSGAPSGAVASSLSRTPFDRRLLPLVVAITEAYPLRVRVIVVVDVVVVQASVGDTVRSVAATVSKLFETMTSSASLLPFFFAVFLTRVSSVNKPSPLYVTYFGVLEGRLPAEAIR